MNILITGGSRGIGRETAICLARDRNNNVLVTGRNEKALKKLVNEAENENIDHYVIDFSDPEKELEFFREHVSSVFSLVDIIINNAGSIFSGSFEDLQDEEIRTMMEVNFFTPVMLIRTLLPYMKKGAHIVNIASMGGFQGSVKFPGMSVYSASKAALACLSECLATEFSDRGIVVNCIAPGSVQTEMLAEVFPGYKAAVSAAEMGEFIAFFAINGSKFFNGKILPVALSTP